MSQYDKNSCRSTHDWFFIYESGKCYLGEAAPGELMAKRRANGDSTVYVGPADSKRASYLETGTLFKITVHGAYLRGYRVRNQFGCRFAGSNWDDVSASENQIFNKRLKDLHSSNDGIACTHFWARSEEELREELTSVWE